MHPRLLIDQSGLSIRQFAQFSGVPRTTFQKALSLEDPPRWVGYVVAGVVGDEMRNPGLLASHGIGDEPSEFLRGDLWAAVTARQCLPLLAEATSPMTYKELDEILAERHPERGPTGTMTKYGHPLGRVGRAVMEIGERWDVSLPPICCLVINGATGLPGEGLDDFLRSYLIATDRSDEAKLLRRERQRIVGMIQEEVLGYPRWDEVVTECLGCAS